jgi:hypothetical protein
MELVAATSPMTKYRVDCEARPLGCSDLWAQIDWLTGHEELNGGRQLFLTHARYTSMNNSRRASSYSAILVSVFATIVCESCTRSSDKPAPQPMTIDRQIPNEEVSAVAPPVADNGQSLDEEVIEAALVDLVAGTDEDAETLLHEQGRGRLLFSRVSRNDVRNLNEELASAASRKWSSLESSDRDATKEAASMIINRVENKQYVAAFQFKDSRISLRASTQPAGRFERPRPIDAAPPGYADQNRLAVVVFGFAWSMHSGSATYVLRFDGRKWNVISRCFEYHV